MDRMGNKVAQQEIAMIKVAAPRMALAVVDRAIQLHGGCGVSQDTLLAEAYAALRTLRLVDARLDARLPLLALPREEGLGEAALDRPVVAPDLAVPGAAAASAASDAAKDAANSLRDAEASSVKASSSYDKACHLADLGASLRDAVHARDAKKETLDRVAQDAGTGGRRSRRDITRDLKRLQDEKEAAVNKRAQVTLGVC